MWAWAEETEGATDRQTDRSPPRVLTPCYMDNTVSSLTDYVQFHFNPIDLLYIDCLYPIEQM